MKMQKMKLHTAAIPMINLTCGKVKVKVTKYISHMIGQLGVSQSICFWNE